MSVTFRQAQAEDCDSVLPMIYSSGPAQLEYVFTQQVKTAHDFLRWVFATGQGMFGYRNYTVAVVDQRPVGIGAFYGRLEGKVLERQLGLQMLRFYGLFQVWPVIKRATQLEAIVPFPDRDMEYIAQLGVAEAMQGQGIGTALLRHQIALARQKGQQRCVLDVAITNPRAQALYERLGFRVTCEHTWPHHDSATAVPDMRRMELLL
jgi:ribosomal protein S18 acetylase RimI-like enzyme